MLKLTDILPDSRQDSRLFVCFQGVRQTFLPAARERIPLGAFELTPMLETHFRHPRTGHVDTTQLVPFCGQTGEKKAEQAEGEMFTHVFAGRWQIVSSHVHCGLSSNIYITRFFFNCSRGLFSGAFIHRSSCGGGSVEYN